MELLSVVQELYTNEISPTFNDLLQQCSLKSFLELRIFELKNKGYVEEILLKDETGDYYRVAYKITDTGQEALERYTSQVQDFVSKVSEVSENGDDATLYKLIEDKRDFLWFAYYKRLITKSQIEDMARRLQINKERFWWGDRQMSAGYSWGWL